jgi:hypothetical protein
MELEGHGAFGEGLIHIAGLFIGGEKMGQHNGLALQSQNRTEPYHNYSKARYCPVQRTVLSIIGPQESTT